MYKGVSRNLGFRDSGLVFEGLGIEVRVIKGTRRRDPFGS